MAQRDRQRESRGEGETEGIGLTEQAEQQRQVAIVAGWRALEAGLPEAACPYPGGDRRQDAWLASYRAARQLAAAARETEALARGLAETTDRMRRSAHGADRHSPNERAA